MPPLLTQTIILACLVLSLAVFHRWRTSNRRTRMKSWEALAQHPDLYLAEAEEPYDRKLAGLVNDVVVEVSLGPGRAGGSLTLCTRIIAQLRGPVPAGTLILSTPHEGRVRHPPQREPMESGIAELDAGYTLFSLDPDKLRTVLVDDVVKSNLQALAEREAFVHINSALITVELPTVIGDDLPKLLREVTELARTLPEAHERPWEAFAEKHSLLYMGAGPEGDFILRGKYEGIRVTVRCALPPGATPITTIRAGIGSSLPRGLRISRRTSPGSEGIDTGDAELTALLQIRAITSADAIAFLQHDELRKALLTVNKEPPGVLVEREHLVVQYPGMLADQLGKRVDAVVGMVMILRKASAAWSATGRSRQKMTG